MKSAFKQSASSLLPDAQLLLKKQPETNLHDLRQLWQLLQGWCCASILQPSGHTHTHNSALTLSKDKAIRANLSLMLLQHSGCLQFLPQDLSTSGQRIWAQMWKFSAPNHHWDQWPAWTPHPRSQGFVMEILIYLECSFDRCSCILPTLADRHVAFSFFFFLRDLGGEDLHFFSRFILFSLCWEEKATIILVFTVTDSLNQGWANFLTRGHSGF